MQRTSQFSAVIQSLRAVVRLLTLGLCVGGTSGGFASTSEPAQAARSLAERLLSDRADQFRFETIPAGHNCDVFEIESRDGKILIRGNNGLAMATGLNWYLRDYCQCHVSLYGSQLALPSPLPPVQPKFTKTAWAKHRYFLNYCCFGYSLPWWDWAEWEKLIDWMALNGVNLPLSVTGQEAVWQAVCRREGLSEAQIFQFLAGPPYLPFFIEMTPPAGDLKYLADLSRAIYDGLATSDAQALWVLQGWAFVNQAQFWTQPRIRAFLDAVPDERMAVLDLFCESAPMWNRTEAFCGKPWLWCNVQNFGRNVYLAGALPKINAEPCAIRLNPAGGKLAGLGFVNEGLEVKL